MSRIRLHGVTKQYGDVTAVDGIDLDITDGEFLVLLGPSGCGKSTLLRMIAGLVEPSAGRLLIDDRDVTDVPPGDRDLAMVFQSYALYPHLSVARNIGFPLRARRRARADIQRRVEEVAAGLDLAALLDRKPRELSGGQRQRVALGRALVRDPGAFLMDEPLSNLDAQLRTSTRANLSDLHRRLGCTFVYVTHDQIEALTMATRVAVLNGGKLEQVGAPAEVYDRPASVFVAGFLGSPAMNLVEATVDTADGRLRVRAPGLDLPLWPGETPTREVVLGIRPESLVRADATTAPIRATVELVENMGHEEVAYLDAGGTRLALRGPRPLGLAPGATTGLTVPLGAIHLFDAATGRRLAWRDTAQTAQPEPEFDTAPA
ncbi:ABC transporter ATP-binding protein [Nocardia sp. alder85J]|uniref:ABC transporter ATP-binding protein n=1 Tax=Nocardia sp. alder85J TaxID=2862949 RepID=UPI001CD4733F|nr:ABC transporter ATP-binding protein [Nocardia sp. alder85J]MCX4091545.1 ABC transporter ATP-binding protein [Nocardia sp. alder85J]